MTSDPKPARRIVASQVEWKELRRKVLAGGRCLIGGCETPATDAHHLIPKSLRGSDVLENLIPLCHEHHAAWEDRVPGWEHIGSMIREELTEGQVAYVVGKKSQLFLDRYYPKRREGC